MSLQVGIGVSQAPDAREAGLQAVHAALDQVNNQPLVLAMLFVPDGIAAAGALAAAATLLGGTPVWGFSSTCPIAGDQYQPRAVVAAVLAASDIRAAAQLWPNYQAADSPAAAQLTRLVKDTAGELAPTESRCVLLAADGFTGGVEETLARLGPLRAPLAGCLASQAAYTGRSVVLGGGQAASAALAAAVLSGNIQAASAWGHGWQDSGALMNVSVARGAQLAGLNETSAAEAYAAIFGRAAREWSSAPLNELVRLYPLGIENPAAAAPPNPLDAEDAALTIRSPLHVDADGSFHLNARVAKGSTGHLLVGNIQQCVRAAEEAARRALAGLNPMKPAFALLLVDAAWRMLLEPVGSPDLQAVRAVLGPDVPAAGGCTFGQIVRPDIHQAPILLNQHMLLVLFSNRTA